MVIPDAAIEAAAKALYPVERFPAKEQEMARTIARAAIEAAMPAIREAIAQEIEADAGISEHPWLNGMKRAALIVRGGTP